MDKYDKINKKILKAMNENRLGDVVALQNETMLEKEKDAIMNKIEELNSHIKPKTNKTKYPHLQKYLLGKDTQSN